MKSVKVYRSDTIKRYYQGASWASAFAVKVAVFLWSAEICQGTARGQLWQHPRIFTNGPAIKGVCGGRRSIRAVWLFFSQDWVTVQGGYGVLFVVMAQILFSITRVAVQG